MGNKQYRSLQEAIRYFDQFGLFQPKEGSAENAYTTIGQQINELYLGFSDSCMSRAEGDKQKADYLFDCSWFEYYWRIVEYNRYQERVKEQLEKQKTINKS